MAAEVRSKKLLFLSMVPSTQLYKFKQIRSGQIFKTDLENEICLHWKAGTLNFIEFLDFITWGRNIYVHIGLLGLRQNQSKL